MAAGTRGEFGRVSRAACWEMRALRDCVRLDAAACSPATPSVTPVSKSVDLRDSTGQLAIYGRLPNLRLYGATLSKQYHFRLLK